MKIKVNNREYEKVDIYLTKEELEIIKKKMKQKGIDKISKYIKYKVIYE